MAYIVIKNSSIFAFLIFTFIELTFSEILKKGLEFDQIVEEYMLRNQIVGLGLAIVKNKEVILKKGYGFQNREEKIPINPEKTLFRWASLSKMITSCIAHKLRNRNIVDFDVEIKNYYYNYQYPDQMSIPCDGKYIIYNNTRYECNNHFAYINISQVPSRTNITIRNLLSHRAGILYYDNGVRSPVPPDEDINNPKVNNGIEWAVEYFMDIPLVSLPGSTYNYSTFGFNLLGEVLIKASNKNKFEELVLEYLNISELYITPDRHWDNYKYPDRCIGYNNNIKTSDNDVSYKLPGGGFMSTLSNCLGFVMDLVYTEKYISNQDKSEAWINIDHSDYGYGFEMFNSSSINYYGIGHRGSQEKAKNVFIFYPVLDTIVLAMSNSENLDQIDFVSHISGFLHNRDILNSLLIDI